MLNIIHYCFTPNNASNIRLLAYLKNIPKSERARVFFLIPDKNKSIITENIERVEIVYCWQKFPIISKISNMLLYYISLFYIKNILDKDSDIIYAYNVPKFLNYFIRNSFKCYSERTEYPEIDNYTSRLIKTNFKNHIKLCKKLQGLFVISTELRNFYLKHGIEDDAIHIINMIVDVSRFKIANENTTDDYLAYCGNASNNKDGVDNLIKSFSVVVKYFPDIRLKIIGKAPDENVGNSNLYLAKSLGIENNIDFIGLISADKVVSLLSNSRILLLNRPDNIQAKYGFPTKLGEYLMTGNPVVITRVGDIPLFLEDGLSAMIADPNDYIEFANKIISLLNNPKNATEIGMTGKSVAMKYFNAEIETKKMFEIINYHK